MEVLGKKEDKGGQKCGGEADKSKKCQGRGKEEARKGGQELACRMEPCQEKKGEKAREQIS